MEYHLEGHTAFWGHNVSEQSISSVTERLQKNAFSISLVSTLLNAILFTQSLPTWGHKSHNTPLRFRNTRYANDNSRHSRHHANTPIGNSGADTIRLHDLPPWSSMAILRTSIALAYRCLFRSRFSVRQSVSHYTNVITAGMMSLHHCVNNDF